MGGYFYLKDVCTLISDFFITVVFAAFGFDFAREVLRQFVEANYKGDATQHAQENVENDEAI